jgi:hypothetical protein
MFGTGPSIIYVLPNHWLNRSSYCAAIQSTQLFDHLCLTTVCLPCNGSLIYLHDLFS